MNPSNPFRTYVDGYNAVSFTFPERKKGKLFYVSIEQHHWIPVSTLVLARDKKDAKKLITDALKFMLDAHEKYRKSEGYGDRKTYDSTEAHIDAIKGALLALAGKKATFKITIIPAPQGQFFKVGWADNDTIF